MMNRRELLEMISVATGIAFVGANAHAYQPVPDADIAWSQFRNEDIDLMDWIAETILPETDTPGARSAGCGLMMAVLAADCYTPEEREVLRNGLVSIAHLSEQQHGGAFATLDARKRHALLAPLDTEARAFNATHGLKNVDSAKPGSQREAGDRSPVPHYFSLLKQLTIFTFFTSERGATEALRYVAIPARYEEIPYQKGDKAWATT